MEKYIAGFYVKIPCEHNVGSCSYSICSNQTEIHPKLLNNQYLSKKCPSVPPATYSVSNLVIDVKKSIPSIADGKFRMNIDFISNYDGHLGCLHLEVNLQL